jgi:hypothetical protein
MAEDAEDVRQKERAVLIVATETYQDSILDEGVNAVTVYLFLASFTSSCSWVQNGISGRANMSDFIYFVKMLLPRNSELNCMSA